MSRETKIKNFEPLREKRAGMALGVSPSVPEGKEEAKKNVQIRKKEYAADSHHSMPLKKSHYEGS